MYKRILLKLSGEALKGSSKDQIFNIDNLAKYADVITQLHQKGIQICVVIGAGNIWRGKLAKEANIEPVPADFMGMLGTVINAVALSSMLNKSGVQSTVFTAVAPIKDVCQLYDIDLAKKSLEEGKVVFLAGGTGKPFYTTDTAATLRAMQLECEAILVGKNGVNGVYDKDPVKNLDAKFIKNLTFNEMIEKNLLIMDISAIQLIQDSDIVIRIFSMEDPLNFIKVSLGEDIGSIVKKEF